MMGNLVGECAYNVSTRRILDIRNAYTKTRIGILIAIAEMRFLQDRLNDLFIFFSAYCRKNILNND